MITVREYQKEDYAMLAGWWKGHGWDAVPEAILPKLGIIVELDGSPTAAGWLYMDNSVGVAMLEWVVTSPGVKPIQAYRGIQNLIGFLSERALELDYGVVLAACRQPALVRVYERNGFTKTDEKVTHLVRVLREK